MKKRLFILAALIAPLVLTWGILVKPHSNARVYQGKTLLEWAVQAYSGDQQAQVVITSLGPRAVPDLMRMLRSHDSWWRVQLWEHSFGLSRARRTALLRHLRSPNSVRLREAAARNLALLGRDSAVATSDLAMALRDDAGRVRWEAAEALARIGPLAIPVLMRALRDDNSQVRQSAAGALGEIGIDASAAMPTLAGMLQDTNDLVRNAAAYSLVAIGTLALAENAGLQLPVAPQARAAALRIRLRYDRSFPVYLEPLICLSRTNNAMSRREAIELLAALHLASDTATGVLTNALTDPDAEVRLSACEGLCQTGPRSALGVQALVTSLSDPSPRVRAGSAQALGSIGPAAAAAIPELRKLTQDDEVNVQAAAKAGLAKIESSSRGKLP